MVTSWDKNLTKEDVFDKKKGWIEPNVKPGSVTCFDLLYYASDKGEEVRESYRATPPAPRSKHRLFLQTKKTTRSSKS